MTKLRTLLAGALLTGVALVGGAAPALAHRDAALAATGTLFRDGECVPAEAYTETTWSTDSPGEGWTATDETRAVVDEPATTETSDWTTEVRTAPWTQIDERTRNGDLITPESYQRWSYNGSDTGPDAPPAFPGDDWQKNTTNPNLYPGTPGPVFNPSNQDAGKGSWFYWEVIPAVYEQITEYRYSREVPAVTHVETLWTLEHEAVVCPPLPDTCPTLDGTQDTDVECPPADLCPEIDGVQTDENDCVVPPIVCGDDAVTPSASPSESPTDAATQEPAGERRCTTPSEEPTISPSESPSQTPTVTPTDGPGDEPTGGALPDAGGPRAWVALLGAVLASAGALLVVATRRRRGVVSDLP